MTTSPPLPGALGTLAPLLDHYGYLAVAGLITLEDFGVPVPGETVLIAAAVYAGVGRLNIIAVVLIAVAAAVIGDNIGYAIGCFGGRRVVERFGRYLLVTPQRLDTAERFFNRHGGKVVTIARFVEGLRQANGIIAGTTGMPWRRFLAFNVLGAALWVGIWTSLGDLAGAHIGAIYDQINRYQSYTLAAAGVFVIVLIVRHVLPHHRRRETTKRSP
ncbi:MAG TPA: DedA family protein [Pseudonocardiaceae bacterium]|jgi:membrane protein DedA with SNARE-associated domain|nr:DedA family protein [Pseudonocardiaceae bacterium]